MKNKEFKKMIVDSFKEWNPHAFDETPHEKYCRCMMDITHISVNDYYDTIKPPVSLTASQLKEAK